ncbi:HAD family hydrolase [Roseivivax sp. THAF30]|uniref:HAD family hydrolase n=1 Tax=Roseivivax sp. THAF30 TaxID=2587852 RepID=UPI00126838BC|nr:hypothetical protein [Roseivivax sp. THAF30]
MASFAAQMHELMEGEAAKAVTPLEIISGPTTNAGIACFSASGRNRDIGVAFKVAAQREFIPLSALVLRDESPLHSLGRRFQYADVVGFQSDSFKDGFLAVASLVASSVLILRAYLAAAPDSEELPSSLEELMHQTVCGWSAEDIASQANDLCLNRTVSLLFTNSLRATSVDLESRFVEAGLGNLHAADLRNFGHGRHFWMHKHKASTSIVCLVGDGMEQLARKSLEALPQEIPRLRIDFRGPKHLQAIAGLVVGLHLSLGAGDASNTDPAKPGVPEFGRRLYRIGPMHPAGSQKELNLNAALARKGVNTLGADTEAWFEHYSNSINFLRDASIQGLVMDYDGTLSDDRDRFKVGLRPKVSEELNRLLEGGLPVGIATGRGPSAGVSLRSSIKRELWGRVLVGYYNGGIISSLRDERDPLLGELDTLDPLLEELRKGAFLSSCEIRANTKQISVKFSRRRDVSRALSEISEALRISGYDKRVVISSHSVDVLLGGQSKLTLVEELCNYAGIDSSTVLRIGDRADPVGNDFQLLKHPLGLSVDQASGDPKTGWALAPAGIRGVQATVFYLERLAKLEETWAMMITPSDRGLTN